MTAHETKGFDILQSAMRYLAGQFSSSMTRDNAEGNLKARSMLVRAERTVLSESAGTTAL